MKSCSPSSKMRFSAPSRRALLLCGLVLPVALGGCSSGGNTDFRSLSAIVRLAFAPPQRVTVKQAAGIPFATIGVRLDNGPQAIATLATDDGTHYLWASGRNVIIATTKSGGNIQRTVGLPQNLSWMIGQQAFTPAVRRQLWSADFADLGVYSAAIQCEELASANVRISILGTRIITRRTNVRCTAPQLKWTFQNTYWTDPQTGLVWRSIQHVHPKLGPIEIETLRPPG